MYQKDKKPTVPTKAATSADPEFYFPTGSGTDPEFYFPTGSGTDPDFYMPTEAERLRQSGRLFRWLRMLPVFKR